MPIYEYACNACGHEWDELQKIGDRPRRKCPDCGALKGKRLISRSSFVLKGSGWYVTDYGKGNGGRAGEQKPAKAEVKAESKAESKAEAKTESKAKAETKVG